MPKTNPQTTNKHFGKTDHEISSIEMKEAWKDFFNLSIYGQTEAFEAGWNAAIESAAKSYLCGERLRGLKGTLNDR